MLNTEEVSKSWVNFKQIDGNEDYPTLFKFTLMGSTYFAAKDKNGKIWTRKSLAGLSGLVNIKTTKLKEFLCSLV